MIFFFGTRSKNTKELPLNHVACTYCQVQNSLTLFTYKTYIHFFWIPIIPIITKSVIECAHCKKMYYEDEFSEEMKRAAKQQA